MIVEDWGLIPYKAALEKQLDLVARVSSGEETHLIFCSHPSVVTLGRASKPEDVMGWSGEICETNRGGRATYHGPHQLIIYPIIDLSKCKKPRDVGAYLRDLESVMIKALSGLGLECSTKSGAEVQDEKSFTGVWVGNKKIASIGIAVKKWVTHHGCAINLRADPLAFSGINPCGFKSSVMTDLESELGKAVDVEILKKAIAAVFGQIQL